MEEPPLRVFGDGHLAACHFPLREPGSAVPQAGHRGRHGRLTAGAESRLWPPGGGCDTARMVARSFGDLVAEGAAEPVAGWDFSWFAGRATEERPSWGYSKLLAERMARARAALDVQTGGGEVLAQIPHPPPVLVATESWRPNVGVARRNLRRVRARIVQADDDADLPFATGSFDLVVSRHPADVVWDEIARVMRPGGTYLSQQVGAGAGAIT